MINVYSGRPEKNSRCEIEEKVYDTLDYLGITYERADHGPADTIEICRNTEKYLEAHVCKNLFLTNNKRDIFCLLLMPGDKKYEAGIVSKQLNSSRLSFAKDEDLENFLGLKRGSVSIMGLINDTKHNVTLAIDEELLRNEFLCCQPCINTSTLKIRTEDILNIFVPHTGHEIKIIQA